MTDERIKVGILGATGSVGQKFVELLSDHLWFTISDIAASDRSAGKKYIDACNWIMQKPLSEKYANMIVKECKPNLDSKIIFSALDAKVAGEIELEFAKAGYIVISNNKCCYTTSHIGRRVSGNPQFRYYRQCTSFHRGGRK
jgi:aspartate-semialdehyde dehydrogenase